ncbi:MAG: hypothetical protein KBA72_08765 [Thermoanaerobaculia bacterium]|nr:hypothetical protein [Thermoanaerobaculia bacterium]
MLDRPRICQYPAARVLVAVLFLLQAGAFAQSQAPMVPSPALLTNERHPLPGTVTGGVPAGDGSVPVYQALANSGVRTVIDLRTEAEVPTETALLAAAAGLDYRRLPVAGEAELDLASARALDLLLDDWSRYPVAVVCGSGNRAGALLAVRAFWLDGARPDAALDLGLRAGLTKLEPAVRLLLGLPPLPLPQPAAESAAAGSAAKPAAKP